MFIGRIVAVLHFTSTKLHFNPFVLIACWLQCIKRHYLRCMLRILSSQILRIRSRSIQLTSAWMIAAVARSVTNSFLVRSYSPRVKSFFCRVDATTAKTAKKLLSCDVMLPHSPTPPPLLYC